MAKKVVEEFAGIHPELDRRVIEDFKEELSAICEGTLTIVHDCAESPIEKIFLSAMLMSFLVQVKLQYLVVMRPMQDAIAEMKSLRRTIPAVQAFARSIAPDKYVAMLDRHRDSGKIDQKQWSSAFGRYWNYCMHKNERELHIVPQASFPGIMPNGRGARADIL